MSMTTKTIAGAVVSKGYDGAAAINFSEKAASFSVFTSFYNAETKKNDVYLTTRCVVFDGDLIERIKKMKIDAGSNIDVTGIVKGRTYVNKDGEKKTVEELVVTAIEYAARPAAPKADGDKAEATPAGGADLDDLPF